MKQFSGREASVLSIDPSRFRLNAGQGPVVSDADRMPTGLVKR